MKHLGDVIVKGIEPKIKYKGGLTPNLDEDPNEDKTYVYFLGIPYAMPPVGDRRFRPPEPYRDDDKTKLYDATQPKPICTQFIGRMGEFVGSEDCLYLNIYLPMKPKNISELLPVLVYFHGGGLYAGSGNYEQRTPDSIMKENIIFVAVNYRLGPFGFLNMHSEECKGNAGLKDQVMALKWVQNNIEAFKGNPKNVTICGESAGGTCVNFHLISPLSQGLFHKAIVMSGGIYCPWGFTGHHRKMMLHYKRYMISEDASRDDVVNKLKKISAEHLLKLGTKIMNREFPIQDDMAICLGPSYECFIEDAFIPPNVTIEELIQQAKPVPILAGITSQEGYTIYKSRFRVVNMNHMKKDEELLRFLMANIRWSFKVAKLYVDSLKKKYFGDLSKLDAPEIGERMATLCTDIWFHRFYDNYQFMRNVELKEGAPGLYIYKFNCVTKMNQTFPFYENMTGAGHGDDISFLFPPIIRRMYYNERADASFKAMIKTMGSLWASFCRDGVPQSSLDPDVIWTPHTEENPSYLLIGDVLRLISERLFEDRWKFMKSIIHPDQQLASLCTTPTTPGKSEEERKCSKDLVKCLLKEVSTETLSESNFDSYYSADSEDEQHYFSCENLGPSTESSQS